MATFGKLTEYDPEQEEWGSYTDRLEFFFTANNIKDAEKKKAILLRSNGSKTCRLFRGPTAPAKPVVTPGSGPSLLGRNWLHHIRLNWKQIFSEFKLGEENESVELKTILNKYSAVFKEELGTMKELRSIST